jgi:hypothetical protein
VISAVVAAELCGITYRQLDYWVRKGLRARCGMTNYDGRISALCQDACQAGECGYPQTVDGCGGCCGCLGGCAEGYEEQLIEESKAGGAAIALAMDARAAADEREVSP